MSHARRVFRRFPLTSIGALSFLAVLTVGLLPGDNRDEGALGAAPAPVLVLPTVPAYALTILPHPVVDPLLDVTGVPPRAYWWLALSPRLAPLVLLDALTWRAWAGMAGRLARSGAPPAA